MDKIEFYQKRDLGERFSASAEFIRQNWMVMYKIILMVAIPLALLQGYFQQIYMSAYLSNITRILTGGDITMMNELYNNAGMWIYVLVSLLSMLALFAISGAILSRYEEGLLSKETTLQDLGNKILSNMANLLMIGLALILFGIVALIVFVLLVAFLTKASGFFAFLIAFVAIIAIVPPLYLVRFPAIFRGASTMESIKEGLQLGFKSWGSTFLMIIIIGIASYVISLVFVLPFTIWNLFNIGSEPGVVSYILSGFSSLSTAFVTPLVFVFLAFQYFSVVEKIEGISLQSKVDEIDNL
jgi:hypothetical protein